MHLSEGVDVFVYGFCHFSINFISVYVWQWCLAGVVLQKIWRCPWYFHCFCWSYFPPLNFISDRRHFVIQQSWYFRLHKPLACCSISMCGHRQLMHCINELLNWQYEHLDHKWATKTNLTLRIPVYIFISRIPSSIFYRKPLFEQTFTHPMTLLVHSETHNLQRVFCSLFLEVPPRKAGHCARHSLWTPWKLELRIVTWSKPCMFCEESVGKIKFRVFPKCVSPKILSLESVDYFGTSEHYWVVQKKKS